MLVLPLLPSSSQHHKLPISLWQHSRRVRKKFLNKFVNFFLVLIAANLYSSNKFTTHSQLSQPYPQYEGASLAAQLVKYPPAMQETPVPFLGREDSLEKEQLPISVFWPGEFHGLYSPWGHRVDATEWLPLHFTSFGWYGNPHRVVGWL